MRFAWLVKQGTSPTKKKREKKRRRHKPIAVSETTNGSCMWKESRTYFSKSGLGAVRLFLLIIQTGHCKQEMDSNTTGTTSDILVTTRRIIYVQIWSRVRKCLHVPSKKIKMSKRTLKLFYLMLGTECDGMQGNLEQEYASVDFKPPENHNPAHLLYIGFLRTWRTGQTTRQCRYLLPIVKVENRFSITCRGHYIFTLARFMQK